MGKRKDLLIFSFKFIISITIIAWLLFFRTSVSDIVKVIKDASLFWLIISFSLHALGMLISAIRWQILIRAQGDCVPLGYLVKSYLVGAFFNNFLPTRIGGDIVRIYDGSRYSQTLVKSSAIILVERLTGVIILFLFALAGSLARLEMAQTLPVIWVSLLLGLGGLVLISLFFLPVSEKFLKILPEKGLLKKIKQKIFQFRETIIAYKQHQGALLKAMFWAFLLQINVIVHFFLMGKALHLDIPLLDYFIFIPIVLLIMLIPITINGLGLREGSYSEIFKFYGIAPGPAVAFGFIDLAFMLIVGIVGGIIYITRK